MSATAVSSGIRRCALSMRCACQRVLVTWHSGSGSLRWACSRDRMRRNRAAKTAQPPAGRVLVAARAVGKATVC